MNDLVLAFQFWLLSNVGWSVVEVDILVKIHNSNNSNPTVDLGEYTGTDMYRCTLHNCTL